MELLVAIAYSCSIGDPAGTAVCNWWLGIGNWEHQNSRTAEHTSW